MAGPSADIRIVESGGSHEVVTLELLRRRGHLERMGVKATRTLVTNGAEAAKLVMDGQADIAMQVGFGPALSAIVNGAPMRVIAAANLLTVHAVYSKNPEIRRLKDLEGRTVGVGALGALTHQLVYAAMLKHRVDPAKVRFVPMGNSASIFVRLLKGEVDAGFGETEVYENQSHYGVHALEDAVLWNELPDFPNQASYAILAAIEHNRDALVRTLAAYGLLYRDLQSPAAAEDYAVAWAASRPDSTPAEGQVQWRFYQRHHPFAEDLMLEPAKLRFMQELNVAMNLQTEILPFDAVADMSLAREAIKLIEAAQMNFRVRRVVTGHDPQGKAIVTSDDIMSNVTSRRPGQEGCVVWATDCIPVDNLDPEDGAHKTEGVTLPGGAVFRVVRYEAGAVGRMHRTRTLDYGVVLSGAIVLELDDGVEVTLRAGDVLVQRGSIHNWTNRAAEPCAIAFVLLDAMPIFPDDH